MLQDVDLEKLKIKTADGKNYELLIFPSKNTVSRYARRRERNTPILSFPTKQHAPSSM